MNTKIRMLLNTNDIWNIAGESELMVVSGSGGCLKRRVLNERVGFIRIQQL
jgi:hypothetical protein